jgi:hypothetical protein
VPPAFSAFQYIPVSWQDGSGGGILDGGKCRCPFLTTSFFRLSVFFSFIVSPFCYWVSPSEDRVL